MGCGASADLLCPACSLRIQVIAPTRCERCGAPTLWPVARCRECSGRRLAFTHARAAVVYAEPVPALVRAWKEGGLRRVTALATELVDAHVERPPADVITSIPPDPRRQLTRHGHPAEQLAHALARRWALEPRPLLARRGSVQRQTGLPRAERRRNVRDAFVLDEQAATRVPERVVLVDDVYTTGSTVSAAASVLRAAGATTVEVVTLARAPR